MSHNLQDFTGRQSWPTMMMSSGFCNFDTVRVFCLLSDFFNEIWHPSTFDNEKPENNDRRSRLFCAQSILDRELKGMKDEDAVIVHLSDIYLFELFTTQD